MRVRINYAIVLITFCVAILNCTGLFLQPAELYNQKISQELVNLSTQKTTIQSPEELNKIVSRGIQHAN